MAFQSTRRPQPWRYLWVAASLLALGAACSGSSGGSGSAATPTSRPHRTPTTRATIPVTRPTTPSAPTTTTQPAPGTVHWVPKSINRTGRVNVTDRLQQFIDRVPDGSVIRFRRNGRYRAEGSLFVSHRNDLTFDGNGATVFATIGGAQDRSQFWVKDSSTIVFRHLNVRGANPKAGTGEGAYNVEQETQHGFRFEGVDGAEIDNVHVSDVYGDFVYIARDKQKVPSQNIWIHDSDFRRNGRQGIAVTAATNVIIERNTFFDTRRSTIDLEPNARSWHVSNVFVLDNTVGKGRLLFVASHGQGPVDNVVISGNRLVGHALNIDAVPPEGKRRSNWIVTDNVSDTTVHTRPLRFFGIDGLVVTGNTQHVKGEQPGVIVTDDCGTRISGNDFGRAPTVRHGDTCAAPIIVPTPPAILGRTSTPPNTTTTRPAPPSTRPHPPTTHHGGPPTTVPPATGSHGGNGIGIWLAIGFVIALAAITSGLFIISRARPGRPPAP